VLAYRKAVARFPTMGTMDIWPAYLAEKTARKETAKARTRDRLQALSKLAEQVAGRYRTVSQPPTGM
jgi:hypothetical protein